MVEPIKDKEKVREIIDYLKVNDMRTAIMFGLGVFCGLRIGDILNLRVRDVKRKWRLKLKQKKTGKRADIVLNRELKEMIDNYTEDMTDSEYLIKSRKGKNKPITRQHAYNIMQQIGEVFEIDNIGCHTMRKTFGYHMYVDNKKNIGLVQKALGHTSSASTLSYIGIEKEVIDNAVKKIKY